MMPALGSFGPLFLLLGLQPHGQIWISYIGAFSITLALLILQKEVCNLRQLIEAIAKLEDSVH